MRKQKKEGRLQHKKSIHQRMTQKYDGWPQYKNGTHGKESIRAPRAPLKS